MSRPSLNESGADDEDGELRLRKWNKSLNKTIIKEEEDVSDNDSPAVMTMQQQKQ